MIHKPERVKNRKLLDEIKKKKCLVGYGCIGKIEPHHITTRGAGGGDTYENCAPVCTSHHREWHMSPGKFIEKYPIVRKWLEANDRWDILDKLDSLNFDLSNKIEIKG